MNLTPKKAPELLLRRIDNEYGYAVNCSYPNSFRILNNAQYEIVDAINNHDDIAELSIKLGIESEGLEKFLSMLEKTEIIRFDDHFSIPQKPDNPKSLNFWIHTTDACNLGCSYCYISTLNISKGMQEHVQKQLLLKLIETVNKRKIKHIKFRLAGGEPLGQFKSWKVFIPEAMSALAAIGCKLDVAFITNLTILNDDILEFSRKYHITYGVSVDGVETVHDATRKFRSGSGSFKIVDTNLRKLLAENIPVSVNTVVSNHNLEGLPELTRYLISLDLPFRYSIVKGENIDAARLEQYLTEAYRIMTNAVYEGWAFSKRHQFCDLKPNELGFQTCASGFSGGAIYVDGSLKYCHVHFGDGVETSPTVFSEDMDLVDMIEQGNHDEDTKSEDCKKCRYRSVCTSGCPVYRVDGKDPQCSIYHKFIPMIYELQAKERLKLLNKYAIV
jgi:uncharacterized protein